MDTQKGTRAIHSVHHSDINHSGRTDRQTDRQRMIGRPEMYWVAASDWTGRRWNYSSRGGTIQLTGADWMEGLGYGDFSSVNNIKLTNTECTPFHFGLQGIGLMATDFPSSSLSRYAHRVQSWSRRSPTLLICSPQWCDSAGPGNITTATTATSSQQVAEDLKLKNALSFWGAKCASLS